MVLSITKGFSALHVNIRSLNKNFGDLNHILYVADHKFSFICFEQQDFVNSFNFTFPNYIPHMEITWLPEIFSTTTGAKRSVLKTRMNGGVDKIK